LFETGAAISYGIGRGCGAGSRGAGGAENDLLRRRTQSGHARLSPDLLRRQITLVGSISSSASRSGTEGLRSEGLRMKALPQKSALSKK
jgi:hypothetical protein